MNHLPWEPEASDRIMILAPHPDDEVLAAGGVIAKTLKRGHQSELRVIIATNGDASYATAFLHHSHLPSKENFRRQAVMRQKESLTALASLGLETTHVHFWGFPDRGLASLWKGRWNRENPYRSPTTSYKSSIQAVNSPVLPYTKASLDVLLETELLEFRPTLIFMPHPYDNHSDHSALAGFTLRAVNRYGQAHQSYPALLTYWMWHPAKPWLTGARPHDLASFYLEADSATGSDLHLTLSPEIHAQKTRALQHYPSQRIPAGKIFRDTSQRMYETFTPLHPT
jgi:LmbE family N-acetylglucosaminyl deacetylase